MKAIELNVNDVRLELESLIQKYPDRRGSILTDDYEGQEDFTCVYYTDENGAPVNTMNYDANDRPVFKTPVCIVGQWIEDFHPEFKNDEVIQSMLMRNATISSLYQEDDPFPKDVKDILAMAQNMQDANNACWKDIVL